MKSIYGDYAQKYFEKGYYPVPLEPRSKGNKLPDWQKKEFYKDPETLVKKYQNWNIGFLLGEASGVIAVDIDDPKSAHLVPPSPVRKTGLKGETRFFRYNGERGRKRHDIGIELLGNNNQTVLPPSIHPEGPEYKWITPDTLLDITPDELPVLPEDFIHIFDEQKKTKERNLRKPANPNARCMHGSHDQLSSMLVAAIHNNETPEHIVKTLLEFDAKINEEISYFECPSRKWRSPDKNLNAYYFVLEGFSRHVRNNEIKHVPIEGPAPIVINLEKPKEDLKRKPLPHLRGMGKIMFDHIYENSLVQRSHYMFASIITTTSIILGNKIRLGKTLPNIYSIIVGESGSGKSSSLNFPIRLLSKCKLQNMIGDSSPASDTGIIQNLPTQRERIDVIDEGDSLFETILSKNSYGKKMASTYATLYTVSGEFFGGKTTGVFKGDKNSTGSIGSCFSPYVSMIIGTTPVGFSKHVDQSIIDSGFLARFLYFFDREKKRSRFRKNRNVEIPEAIISFVKMWRDENVKGNLNLNIKPTDEFYIRDILCEQDALEELEKTHEMIEDIKASEMPDSKIRSILERSMENLEKIAIIDCALVNYTTTDIVLTKDNVLWAREFILTHIHNTKIALGLHVTEGPRAELAKKMLAFIEAKKSVTQSEITRKFQNTPKKIRDEVLRDLIEIAEVRKTEDDKRVTSYQRC